MMKNIIKILLPAVLLSSCLIPAPESSESNDHDNINATEGQQDDFSLISNIDEYVNEIRETIEETSITKRQTGKGQEVMFVKNSDTVKISVLSDSTAITTSTDIYYQNSEPVFASRNVILDVDSSYLETAYFKDGELYKCFRNGAEVSNRLYASEFMRHIAQ